MQTMKNKVGQNLDKSWTVFRGNKLGQYWYKSSTDFRESSWQKWAKLGRKKVQRGYGQVTTFLRIGVCQGYTNGMPEFWSNKLLQSYSSITPIIGGQLLQFFSNTSPEIAEQRLRQSYTNPTPKYERFSFKGLSQQLPNAYPENKDFSLNKSGQSRYEIGTENCVKVSSWVRQLGGYKVMQLLGETCVDLEPFYPAIIQVIQPLSFIADSLIVHNKRVQDKRLDIPKLFLYVVLPDQSL